MLDKFYTCEKVAADCIEQLGEFYDLGSWILVEPSAGAGAFYRSMPSNSIAFDIAPGDRVIIEADFLGLELSSDHRIMVVGNPPFGKNACTAVRFFNHAAQQSDVIAMIFPRSFRKASIENRLDPAFHLMHCEDVPPNAFEFEGQRRNVAAIFQIWQRRDSHRELQVDETSHPDFEFTTPDLADFVIRRVGAKAGQISRGRDVHADSHYFIKGDVEDIMAHLDLIGAARNATSTPSLAKSEIVALYRKRVGVKAKMA